MLTELTLCILISQSSAESVEGSLAASERLMERETDSTRRVQLLIRWMALKEASLPMDQAEASRQILARLQKELPQLETLSTPGDLDPIYRYIGWKQTSNKQWAEAVQTFQKMYQRQPKDEIVLGDSLLASGLATVALDSYVRAKSHLPHLVAYKSAWAYLQLNDFEASLKSFDEALKLPPTPEGDVRAEAFRERMIPYAEVYKDSKLGATQLTEIRSLAQSVFSNAPETKVNSEVEEALRQLVESFLGRGQTDLARQTYQELLALAPNQQDFFLKTAPLWLSIYRGKLEHAESLKLLAQLPKAPLDASAHANLKTELANSIKFFEKLYQEGQDKVLKELLLEVYAKAFVLFPVDEVFAQARVNAAKIAFDEGRSDDCLALLKDFPFSEAATKDVSRRLEAQCRIKRLEAWAKSPQNPKLSEELQAALSTERFYQALESEAQPGIYLDLVRLLISETRRKSDDPVLQDLVVSTSENFGFPNLTGTELTVRESLNLVAKEVKFTRLVAQSKSSAEFMELFNQSPQESEVAQKAFQNAMLLASEEEMSKLCPQFDKKYPGVGKFDEPYYKRCYQVAERSGDLADMRRILTTSLDKLTETEKVNLALVELALQKPEGRARMKALKTSESQQALNLWDSVNSKPSRSPLATKAKEIPLGVSVNLDLPKVTRKEMDKKIPPKIEAWEKIDQSLVKAIEASQSAPERARLFEARAQLAARMFQWVKTFPALGSKTDELKEIHRVWKEQFDERARDCSLYAYEADPSFQPKNLQVCPEVAWKDRHEQLLSVWKRELQDFEARETAQTESEVVVHWLSRSLQNPQSMESRYWAFRILDHAQRASTKAKALRILHQQSGDESYLGRALSLNAFDGDLIADEGKIIKENKFWKDLRKLKLETLKSRAESLRTALKE